MAKKTTKGSGSLDSLTLKQTDKLARHLGRGANRLVAENRSGPFNQDRHDTAMEIFAVSKDLHNSWMEKFHKANP